MQILLEFLIKMIYKSAYLDKIQIHLQQYTRAIPNGPLTPPADQMTMINRPCSKMHQGHIWVVQEITPGLGVKVTSCHLKIHQTALSDCLLLVGTILLLTVENIRYPEVCRS